MISIETSDLGKKYGSNRLFRNISMRFEQPGAYAITGFNGSGKSTFLLCLAGFVTPTEGKVTWHQNGRLLKEAPGHFAFCSPALELFEELSLTEHLLHHNSFSPHFNLAGATADLELYGLHKARNKAIRSFSSGMKQRLKLLLAFNNDVPVLFMDEPCSNLDEHGINLYKAQLTRKAAQKLVIVATNQPLTEFPLQGMHIQVDEKK